MQPGDIAHERHDDVPHERDRPGEAHDAHVPAVGGMCGGVIERLRRAHGLASRPQQRLPVLGEGQGVRRAVQQPHACTLLESGDGLGHASCRHAEATAGLGDGAGAHHGDETSQLRHGNLKVESVHGPQCILLAPNASTPHAATAGVGPWPRPAPSCGEPYFNPGKEQNDRLPRGRYETYLSAWSAVPDDERLRLLRESVTEAIVFKNPMQTRAGLADVAEHLAGFQARSPGGSFRHNAMLGWGDNAMATWQFVDAEGNGGFTGYDILAFGEHRRIESIVLFGNVEKQTLK